MDPGAVTLTAFAAQHSLGLTRFADVLTGDRQLAEDLVQDCFLACIAGSARRCRSRRRWPTRAE
ncbi:MAG TPA: hypothetical protein VGL39_26535 [Jatrophihabitantaceae bacterium]